MARTEPLRALQGWEDGRERSVRRDGLDGSERVEIEGAE